VVCNIKTSSIQVLGDTPCGLAGFAGFCNFVLCTTMLGTTTDQVRGFGLAGLASLGGTLLWHMEQCRSGVIPEQTIIQPEMLHRLCAVPL